MLRLRAVLLALLIAGLTPGIARARDVFVVISGGISPFENQYSQFLQARALTRWLRERYPAGSVFVFFGAGNVEGRPPVLNDVHRVTRRDGVLVDTWVPGALPGNRPAAREGILKALRTEILPAVADGGTLFLLVGDHGSRRTEGTREAEINLWSLRRDPADERGWSEVDGDVLTVSALQDALRTGLGKGQVVFSMTQCHSGGFQFLGVPRALEVNPSWFTAPTPAGRPSATAGTVNAAGFTSTDERSIAAGCDPSPDPDRWSGYERLMPERLTGRDLMTGRVLQTPAGSLARAHEAAVLDDQTIDLPYSTSDQYLERWATLIESKLVGRTTLTPAVAAAAQAYTRAVDTGVMNAADPAWRSRASTFSTLVSRMAEQNPSVRGLITRGGRRQLEMALESDEEPVERPGLSLIHI